MKIDKECQLFFGCKIDSKLNDALTNAKPGDRRYFEDPDKGFLRICTVGEERWIGKLVKAGVASTDVEDVQRNVISILRRIAPDVRRAPSTVKIFSVDESADVLVEEPKDKQGSSGPYIANY